jgi:hypothetical protein
MGIDVKLQRENGEVLEEIFDEKNILSKLLPRQDNSLLSGIDPYGDTTFNRLQIEKLLLELTELQTQSLNQDQIQQLAKIRELAEKCNSGVHRYLKFVGD